MRSPSLRRMTAGVIAGACGAALSALWAPWQLSLLLGWIAAGAVYLTVAWRVILSSDGARTRALATIEDDSRAASAILVIVAATSSLAGAALAVRRASSDADATSIVLTVAAIATVVVSWAVVNTDFTLHYAHLFHSNPAGGVSFAGVDSPDFRDFAYLAFTVGMTYQVSDTALLGPRFRRVLLAHAMVSYVFGTVVIASVINLVAGLVR